MATGVEARRRLRRRLRSAPLIGGLLGRASTAYRVLRSPHEHVVTAANSRLAYGRLWRNPRLHEQYLTQPRLQFYDELAAILAELSPESVIDAGCGSGHLLAALAALTGIQDVTGFDNVRSAVRLAERTLPAGRFFVADLDTLSPDRTFDLVICSEVLEHLERPERAVERLLLLARPGGHVVITVPDGSVDAWEGHVNFWDRAALATMLEPYGLSEIRVMDDPVCPALVAILEIAGEATPLDPYDLDPPHGTGQAWRRRALRAARRRLAPEIGNWSAAEVSGQAASDLIAATLERSGPALVARLGAGELAAVTNHLGVHSNRALRPVQALRYVVGRSGPWWWERSIVSDLATIAGFFPTTVSALERFGQLMLESMPAVDVLGSWLPEERIVRNRLREATRVRLRDLEPYYHRDPWSAVLEGRTVLVVHPFAATIASQYERRERLFADPRVLPDFELKTLTAVQSIAGTPTRFASWFEALDSMCEEVAAIDFDTAIIGCGAYGFPLAAHVKALGKQAVHLGGATQILFGIKGRRWDEHPVISQLYNESWVRPAPAETPAAYERAEGGAYW